MLEKLQNLKLIGSVAVLNDFFLDRIIKIDNITKLFDLVLQKKTLGGSIRNIPQVDLKGGNATNVAFALARLGSQVSLITIADKTSSQILQETFYEFPKSSLYVIDGKPGLTTSFEFNNDGSIVNIMLSDLGDNENSGPERLGLREQNVVQNADAVIVTNWESNKKGTELSKFVVEKSPKSLHFLDPAVIQTRQDEFKMAIPELAPNLDSLSLNENECNFLLKQFQLGNITKENETKNLISKLS